MATIDSERGAVEARLLDHAAALRPHLLAGQAATEARTYFSEETHALFKDAGFYLTLAPRRFGGLELSISSFYKIMIEIARGCPSSGWQLCLSAGHALQLASYFPALAQEEMFGGGERQFIASMSLAPQDAAARRVDGGYRLQGTWHFASGSPWASHHIGLAMLAADASHAEALPMLFIVPSEKFERLDNWGDLIGLRGSGSHSLVVAETFIPAHHAVPFSFPVMDLSDDTPGYKLHGNPMYCGQFMGFALGELNSVQTGNALAMLDEYEQIITSRSKFAIFGETPRRYTDHDFQRCFGQAMAWTDAAHSIMVRTGELYEQYARESVARTGEFDAERTLRLYGQHMTVQKLCWEAGDTLFRTSSTSGARDGSRMQRYWRDLCAFRSNGLHQFDFRAHALAQAHFGLPVAFT
jgi:3-hydroxy-9,10-secoandrosta-1,3,5(10)-triene-9,17-dione monooxygenase